MTNDPVDRYFSPQGVLLLWPSPKKRRVQEGVLRRLGLVFELGRDYSEGEINDLLKQFLGFDDYVLVRRELIELGVLKRTRDGRRYWRTEVADRTV